MIRKCRACPGRPLSAADLNRAMDLADRSKRITATAPMQVIRHEGGYHITGPWTDCFDANLTAVDAGTGHYAWTEQAPDVLGNLINKPGGRSGTTTQNWGIERNNSIVQSTALPRKVWMCRRVQADSGDVVFEFDLNSGSGNHVSCVCGLVTGVACINGQTVLTTQCLRIDWDSQTAQLVENCATLPVVPPGPGIGTGTDGGTSTMSARWLGAGVGTSSGTSTMSADSTDSTNAAGGAFL